MVAATSCTPKEEEQEPDYDRMVMADEEEEWSPSNDQKNVADCDPQEFIILDPESKTDNLNNNSF
jgi:hypothetical protein